MISPGRWCEVDTISQHSLICPTNACILNYSFRQQKASEMKQTEYEICIIHQCCGSSHITVIILQRSSLDVTSEIAAALPRPFY